MKPGFSAGAEGFRSSVRYKEPAMGSHLLGLVGAPSIAMEPPRCLVQFMPAHVEPDGGTSPVLCHCWCGGIARPGHPTVLMQVQLK